MSPRETAAEREARMMRAAAGRQDDAQPKPQRAATMRTKPVRTTVDMTPELHRQMKAWAAFAAAELEVVDVPTANVIRALVRKLIEDDRLGEDILKDLRDGLQ